VELQEKFFEMKSAKEFELEQLQASWGLSANLTNAVLAKDSQLSHMTKQVNECERMLEEKTRIKNKLVWMNFEFIASPTYHMFV
jgi:flagellar biosynthesis chaperone FliJ